MSLVPTYLTLKGGVSGADRVDVVRACVEAFGVADLPRPLGWAAPAGTPAQSWPQGSDPASVIEHALLSAGEGQSLQIEFEEEAFATLHRPGTASSVDPPAWALSLNLRVPRDPATGLLRLIQCSAEFCRALARERRLVHAVLSREGPGAECLPEVPVAGFRSHAVVTSREAVARAYVSESSFWESGWESYEQFEDVALVLRACHTVNGPEYLAAVQDQQWTLARAARPGLTRYDLPRPQPAEKRTYRSGEPCLEVVGYLPDERLVELSAYVPDGAHVRGWEIFNVLALVAEGRLDDGRPVDLVRVVFFDRAMAEAEKRPLLDIGARVYYQGDSGDIIKVSA